MTTARSAPVSDPESHRFFYGWVILAACFVVTTVASGTMMGFGVFITPMAEDMGWSHSALSFSYALSAMVTGIGVLIGVLSTLLATVPQLFDRAQKLADQRNALAQVEADITAYSRVMKRFRHLLSPAQMRDFFQQDASLLLAVDTGSRDTDDWLSAQLKKSPEGAYFIWCQGGMNSDTAGAFYGYWVTRPQAMRCAQEYATWNQAVEVFSEEELRRVDETLQIDRCGNGVS